MQSWLGACVIAGCAIGATGIVIHHYAKQPCPEQEVTYMISYDDWGRGIINEFNRAISLTGFKSREWDDSDEKWNNGTSQATETLRHKCVDNFAKLYGLEYASQEVEKKQTKLAIDVNHLGSLINDKCLFKKPETTTPV